MTKAADLSKTGSFVNTSGQLSLTTGVTGILPVANGGTGTSTGVAPGGSTTQVQYNNAGAFGGDSGFVYSSGNVGIGTSSPSTRLHVKSADNTNAALIVENLNNTNGILQFGSASSSYAIFGGAYQGQMTYNTGAGTPHIWWVGGSEKMRLDSSGNLGLGVTPSAWSASFKAMQVGTVGSFYTATNSAVIGCNTYNDGSSKYITTNAASAYTQGAGVHAWYNAPSGTAGNAITFTQAMTLDASGRLQVSPTAGTGMVAVGDTAGGGTYNCGIYRGAAASVGSGDYFNIGGYSGIVFTTGAAALGSQTERMRIDSSGNVGIGTSSPSTKLTVSSTYTSNRGQLSVVSTDTDVGQTFYVGSTFHGVLSFSSSLGYIGTASNTPLVFGANNAERVRVSAAGGFSVGTTADPGAGAIYATGNITAYYSDDRLKTKLGGIDNALDKVKSLSGFYYEANQTAQDLGYQAVREVGVSAQQVQAVLPEVVKPAPIDQQYLTVDYERLVPLLIEAIKELEEKVAKLEAK